jgi:hypothetical protein
MRRILFTLLASGALFAAVPAVSLAHSGHHQRSHHRTVRHHRIRHEHFAGAGPTAGTPTAGTPSPAAENAGTVASFTNGVLVITLNDGSTVSGAVTSATELECEAAAPMQTMDRGPGGGDNGSGNNAGDNGDRGDDGDQGDRGEDNNDNNMCTTITPGMVVREANLTISGSGAAWNKVELITS